VLLLPHGLKLMNVPIENKSESITQQDVTDAIASASSEIRSYLLAKREYVNLSDDINKRLAKLLTNYIKDD